MTEHYDGLQEHLSELERLVRDLPNIWSDANQRELDHFEQLASWIQACGTITGHRGRSVGRRVDEIIRDMEGIRRGSAAGMDVLRDFLLMQQRASCEELQEELDAISEKHKERQVTKPEDIVRSSDANDKSEKGPSEAEHEDQNKVRALFADERSKAAQMLIYQIQHCHEPKEEEQGKTNPKSSVSKSKKKKKNRRKGSDTTPSQNITSSLLPTTTSIFPLNISSIETSFRTYTTTTASPPFKLHFDEAYNQYYARDCFANFGEGNLHVAYPAHTQIVEWKADWAKVNILTTGKDPAVGEICMLVMENMDDVGVLIEHMEGMGMQILER
ncbi:MAG: hypothetical protein Q9168_002727 [Polycauliona sp. 1 TL-2023]